MLTLKKVKELVEAPVHTKRVPSPKVLLEEGLILMRKEFDHGSHLTVYQSGYVLFSAGKRNTVFHIHDCCGDYSYDAAAGRGDVIKEEYFENCEWHIRALFEGERKMEESQWKCEGTGQGNGVRSGEIDTIIVKDLSRFGRDYIGVGEYMEQIFPLLGVRLISVNDNYDSNNYNGATLGMDLVVSNLVNTMYCRDAGKKLRTANRVKWRKGISTASSAPFGYQFDPNKKGSYIIDPPAAKIVRRIFDLAILGLRTREIAMTLNDENAPVPSVYNREHKAYGKETTYTIAPVILWDSTRVWKILTAYVYTGAMVLGKSQRLISGKSISRTVPKGQQYITEGTHEAIVSREEFEKAQLVINNRNKVVMGSVDFPLKGKVRCGNCRRAMGYDYKQTSPIFWCREGQELIGQTKCSSEIFQANDIENAVFQALKKELSLLGSLYGDIKKEEQSLKEASRKASRRKTSMEQELKNLKGEKMRMYEEYAAGTLSLDNYKNKKQEYDRKIAEVQDKIEQSKAEEAAQSVVPGTVRAAAEQAENFLHGTRLTASMVSAFIENVYVHEGGRIVVQFKYEQSIQDAVRALHTD